MRLRFYKYFHFGDGVLQFPTVSIVGSNGKVIQCHRTITQEEWQREPWYGRLVILSFLKLDSTCGHIGWRLWVYTRWGTCYFDFVVDQRTQENKP